MLIYKSIHPYYDSHFQKVEHSIIDILSITFDEEDKVNCSVSSGKSEIEAGLQYDIILILPSAIVHYDIQFIAYNEREF